MNFFKHICMACPVASNFALGGLKKKKSSVKTIEKSEKKISSQQKEIRTKCDIVHYSLVTFSFRAILKMRCYIALEALATCFVQARITRRQAKS